MVRLGDSIVTPQTVARSLADAGLQVFPARYRNKIPLVKWEQYQGQNVSNMIDTWFKNRWKINFWVMTGQGSKVIVVDGDTREGEEWWRDKLGEVIDRTTRVETRKGHHYYLRIPEGWKDPVPSWSCHPSDSNISFDVRADNTGVIVPPSIHETGFHYKWEVPLSEIQEAPLALLDGSLRAASPRGSGESGESTRTGTDGQPRSMLARLLADPPGEEGSGRNDWLTKVAGHYAKTYHQLQDLYTAHCIAANRSMREPLDDEEFQKTIDSVWRGEHERHKTRALDDTCGYLMSGGSVILCQVAYSNNGEKRYDLAKYANFDLVAKGVMQNDENHRTYLAQINRQRPSDGSVESIDIILRAEILGDDRKLRKFLAQYACVVIPPDNAYPRGAGSPGVRLQCYLESQCPPVVQITNCLGYDPDAVKPGHGGFITHDGIITGDGLLPFDEAAVRADPALKTNGTAPFHYGFEGDLDLAQQTLREVMTFQDEQITAVYGAWWAACLLKPQIEAETSLFPFMAIEAPSESGKTNGFFAMMLQLSGNTRGETQPTKAALRDMTAANRNGAVWVDDLDDPANLMELFRIATSGGSVDKMTEDHVSVKSTAMVSPIVISGEALGLGTQKALVDRAIFLTVPSPVGRRSLFDPTRAQWEDILSVRRQYPGGLHAVAGWFVMEALRNEERALEALAAGRKRGSAGRSPEKVAVLRAGACLLDHLLGHDDAWERRGDTALRLEEWLQRTGVTDLQGAARVSNDNALTLEVLPWALRKGKFPDQATTDDPGFYHSDTPAYIFNAAVKYRDATATGQALEEGLEYEDDMEVRFSPALLAEAWAHDNHGRIDRRTHTETSFRGQAKNVGGRPIQVRVVGSRKRPYYLTIKGEAAIMIMRRALGEV